MPQIDFYTNASDKLRTACVLSNKALASGQRVAIYLDDANTAERLNQLLWEYPATSFVTHCYSHEADAAQVAAVLFYGELPIPSTPLLINLATTMPPAIEQFQRILEVVADETPDSQAGRGRYKHYRELGYNLGHFDLRK